MPISRFKLDFAFMTTVVHQLKLCPVIMSSSWIFPESAAIIFKNRLHWENCTGYFYTTQYCFAPQVTLHISNVILCLLVYALQYGVSMHLACLRSANKYLPKKKKKEYKEGYYEGIMETLGWLLWRLC